jgi:hypothetical protein
VIIRDVQGGHGNSKSPFHVSAGADGMFFRQGFESSAIFVVQVLRDDDPHDDNLVATLRDYAERRTTDRTRALSWADSQV